MIDDPQLVVKEYIKKYKVSNITKKSICDSLEDKGYTLIFFNKIINEENVSEVIKNLKLEREIENNKGFTFTNDKYRLVFINEDLSDEEQILVLAHELGHICLEHTAYKSIIGQDVREEHDANEFAHYLLYPSRSTKMKRWMKKRKKVVIAFFAVFLALAIGTTAFLLVSKQKSYYGEYYLTETGAKYHKKECIYIKNKTNIHRMTKEEYKSGEYDACKACLPDNE